MKFDSKDIKSTQTINLSCRIGKPEYDLLVTEARNKGTSLNSLVNSIFKRYLAWEKTSDEIGFIPLSKRTITQIFDCLSEKEIKDIAKDIGKTIPRELTFLMFNKIDFISIMSMIEIYSSRFGVLKHEITGSRHDLTLYHGITKKFSQYLASVMESMAEDLSLNLKINSIDNGILSLMIEEFDNIYNR